jgi:hypothetical protein
VWHVVRTAHGFVLLLKLAPREKTRRSVAGISAELCPER